jgi:tetratricopeptide (TPR) repeat protein
LLFGIATLHVESVAWISERKDVLYALFFIASLIAYVYYVKYRKLKYYIISFVLFILSLFSKGQAVSLAVSIIAIDYLFDRKLLDKKLILEKIPYFILAFVFGIIAIKAQQAGNALHDADSYEFYKRIGFAGYAFTQYLIKLLIPVGLSAIYPYPDIINKAIPNYYWLFMIPSFLVVYAFFYFLKRSKTVAFFIAFFIINIVLLLQLIPVGSAIWADRYSYIPSIAYYALIAWLIHQLVNNFESKRMFIYGITGIYILSLAIASFERCKVWESSAILWDDTVEKSPKAVVAWNNRGSIKDKDEDHTGAIEDFTRAIVLKPDYTHAFYNRAVAKRNLAKIRKDSTLLKSAIQDFEKAIKFDPKFVEAIHNKGLAIETLSDYMQLPDQKNILLLKALADYDETLELNPEYVSALVSRGVVKGKLNHLDEAIEIFNKAISMKPENEQAYVNRGLAKDLKGDFNGAIADYNMAVQLKPDFDNALLNRGIVYRKLQNYQASINDFSEAIRINPKLEAAWYFRGLDLIMTDHKEAGCKDLQMAEQLGYPYAKQQIQIYCNK